MHMHMCLRYRRDTMDSVSMAKFWVHEYVDELDTNTVPVFVLYYYDEPAVHNQHKTFLSY